MMTTINIAITRTMILTLALPLGLLPIVLWLALGWLDGLDELEALLGPATPILVVTVEAVSDGVGALRLGRVPPRG